MHRRDVVIGLPAALAGLGLTGAHAADRAVTVAFPSDVLDWVPTISGSPTTMSIIKCVFDQPLEMAPDLALRPSLVTAYKWLDKEGKTLQVDLRDDVTFHNGDKFTSDDFRFTFYDHVKANPLSLLAGTWARVTGIDTPSATRAILHFNAPFVIGPSELSDLPAFILPRRYFEKVGLEGFRKKPIGTGPYRLVDYQRNSRIQLEAYDKYWGGAARIKRLTFQIVADPVARAAAVQSGQADITLNLPVREVERLRAERLLERKHALLEQRIAELRAEFAAEEVDLKAVAASVQAREQERVASRDRMSQMRGVRAAEPAARAATKTKRAKR